MFVSYGVAVPALVGVRDGQSDGLGSVEARTEADPTPDHGGAPEPEDLERPRPRVDVGAEPHPSLRRDVEPSVGPPSALRRSASPHGP